MSRFLGGLAVGFGQGVAAQGRALHEASIAELRQQRQDKLIAEERKARQDALKQKQQADALKRADAERIRQEDIARQNALPKSTAGKLASDLSNGLISQDQYDNAVKKNDNGFTVFSENGNPIATTGNPANLSIKASKETSNQIQKDIVEIDGSLQRLDNIVAGFKPEFLEVGTRLNLASIATQEKLGLDINPADKSQLEAFTHFKRDAIEQLNTTIQDITGAAITESEAPRIKGQIPDVGQGILDGDSPTEFQSKLNGVIRSLRQARARHTYTLSRGIKFNSIPLGSIDAVMRERAAELKESGISDDQLKETLAQEFGL